VFRVLSRSSSLSQKEIKNKTGLSIRSVKGSLKLLREEDIIEEIPVFEDMRRKKYVLRGESK